MPRKATVLGHRGAGHMGGRAMIRTIGLLVLVLAGPAAWANEIVGVTRISATEIDVQIQGLEPGSRYYIQSSSGPRNLTLEAGTEFDAITATEVRRVLLEADEPVFFRVGTVPSVFDQPTLPPADPTVVVYGEAIEHRLGPDDVFTNPFAPQVAFPLDPQLWVAEQTAGRTQRELELLVYLPEDGPILPNRPAHLLFHGGGFVGGGKENGNLRDVAMDLVSRGWVVFSIDYRLRDEYGLVPREWYDRIIALTGFDPRDTASIPGSGASAQQWAAYSSDFLDFSRSMTLYPSSRDAKAAVRWVRAHAHTYNINPDFITVGGGSAGSILAVMAGVMDEPDYKDELRGVDSTLDSTYLDQSSAVRAIVDYWGSGLLIEFFGLVYGPPSRLDSTDAPMVIVHGRDDTTVLFERGLELQQIWTDNGVNHEFYPLYPLNALGVPDETILVPDQNSGHSAWGAIVELPDGTLQTIENLAREFLIENLGLTILP